MDSKVGCLGYKLGMSSLQADGKVKRVPVTLLHIPVNLVTAHKLPERDGYSAIQVASCAVAPNEYDALGSAEAESASSPSDSKEEVVAASEEGSSSGQSSAAPEAEAASSESEASYQNFARARKRWLKKPLQKHFAPSLAREIIDVCEFRVAADSLSDFELGKQLDLSEWQPGDCVNARAVSKGRGFAGGIKRWGFGRQPETHGTSVSHRALGSTGQCQGPSKVFKGKKMAGHYGAEQVCIRNLQVVQVDPKRRIVAVKGSVPGARGSKVTLQPVVR